MSRKFLFAFAILFILSASSCVLRKNVYSPTSINVLQADEKNDVKVALNYSTAGQFLFFNSERRSSNGIDLQTLFAVTPRMALKLDGYSKGERNSRNNFLDSTDVNSFIDYRKRNIELSAGIYNFSKDKKYSIFQLYGGIGLGTTSFNGVFDATNSLQKNNYSAEFIKYFIQPSVSIRGGSNYTFTIGSRLNLLNFKNIETDYPDIENEILGYIDNKPSFFMDLMINNEFGFKSLSGIKFQTQLGSTLLFTQFTDLSSSLAYRGQYDYNSIWFNLGAIADLNTLFKKK